jgi:hypothetical protein
MVGTSKKLMISKNGKVSLERSCPIDRITVQSTGTFAMKCEFDKILGWYGILLCRNRTVRYVPVDILLTRLAKVSILG